MQEPQLPADPVERLNALRAIAAKVLAHAESKATSALASSQAAIPQQAAPQPAPAAPPPVPATGNPAIDHCLAAHAQARQAAIASGKDASTAKDAGKAAYLRAMPPLAGPENVANFIACVIRGHIEDIVYAYEINRFLYAAQVANCVRNPPALPTPKRPRGRPKPEQDPVPGAEGPDNSSVNSPAEN